MTPRIFLRKIIRKLVGKNRQIISFAGHYFVPDRQKGEVRFWPLGMFFPFHLREEISVSTDETKEAKKCVDLRRPKREKEETKWPTTTTAEEEKQPKKKLLFDDLCHSFSSARNFGVVRLFRDDARVGV